jgi:hypothetical protein
MRSAAAKQLLWPAQLKRRANPISRIVCCAQAAAVRQGQGRGPSREGQAWVCGGLGCPVSRSSGAATTLPCVLRRMYSCRWYAPSTDVHERFRQRHTENRARTHACTNVLHPPPRAHHERAAGLLLKTFLPCCARASRVLVVPRSRLSALRGAWAGRAQPPREDASARPPHARDAPDLRRLGAAEGPDAVVGLARCPTSAPGLGSPLPTSAPGLGSPPPTSAPGLGSPLPHLHRDWAAMRSVRLGPSALP